MKKFNIPPLPAVLGSILSVQVGAAVAKGLFPALGAGSTVLIRIGLSAVILVLVNRPAIGSLTKKQWHAVIPYGICLGVMNVIFYLAIERIPLGIAVTLEFIGPLLLAVITSKRKIDFLWIALAAAGIMLISPWNENGVDLLGAAMAVVAGMLWAGYIVLGRRSSVVLDGTLSVTIGMIFATIVALPVGVASGGLSHFTSAMIIPAIGLALLSSAIPFSLEIEALKQIPAKTFSILMSLEPVVAALCGVIFLKEYLTLPECAAIVLVVIASTGTMLTKE
jgi:inner membrane transporter RhtA